MNLVRGHYYSIYLNIFLLISFHRVDAVNEPRVLDPDDPELRVQPLINLENNEGQNAEQNWSYDDNPNEVRRRFKSAWNYLLAEARHNLKSVERPSQVQLNNMIKQILNAKITSKSQQDLVNLCNEAWAKYLNGTSTSLSDATIAKYSLYIPSEGEQIAEMPALYCRNETIEDFEFLILTMYDNESTSATDIHFIYWIKNSAELGSPSYLYLYE